MDSGSGGSELEVVNFSGTCHKRFRTLAQAEAFIADWVEMYACVVKAQIKEELLDGHRPTKMKGLPVEHSLKTEGNDDEDELTDVFSKTRIE